MPSLSDRIHYFLIDIIKVYTSHIVLSISGITELSFHILLNFSLNLPPR
jgi:hypothetical protein